MAPVYYVAVAFPCTVGAIALTTLHIYRHLLNYTEPTYQRFIVRIVFMVPIRQHFLGAPRENWMAPVYYVAVAFPCTVGAIALTTLHIYRHLLNYTEPTYQRFIVRIVFMVPIRQHFLGAPREKWVAHVYYVVVTFPHMLGAIALMTLHIYRHLLGYTEPTYQRFIVYALMSLLSLVFNESSIYFDSIREIYEAWVIYNFLSLCLAWVGGPGAVELSLSGRFLKPSWYLMTCCFPAIPLDGRFIRRCKQGCLQFVILKPILVGITFILYAKGKFEDGNFSVDQGYLYITIIYTLSYSMALYALALFYVACRDLLRPFNPVPKFIIIKSVVFLTYWQGVLVFLAAKSGFIKNADEAADFQNFVLCVEMLAAAVGHFYAFPYKEYAGANIGASAGFTGSLGHALKFNDFYHDTVHQFAPTYHDYVLYNNSEGDDGARKYRSRTFVPTGQEMDAVRRNKQIHDSRIDEIQLSSISTPNTLLDEADLEAIKSSPVKESNASSAEPYDLSMLADTDLSSYPAEDELSKR